MAENNWSSSRAPGSRPNESRSSEHSKSPKHRHPDAPAEGTLPGLKWPVKVYRPPPEYFDQSRFPQGIGVGVRDNQPNCFFCGDPKKTHDHKRCTRKCLVCGEEPGHRGRVCPLMYATSSWWYGKGFNLDDCLALETLKPSKREAEILAQAGYLEYTVDQNVNGNELVSITWLNPRNGPMENPVPHVPSKPSAKKRAASGDYGSRAQSPPAAARRKIDETRWAPGRVEDPLPAILEHIGLPHLLAIFKSHDADTWAVASCLKQSDMDKMGISIGNQVWFLKQVKTNPKGILPSSSRSQSNQRPGSPPRTQPPSRFTASHGPNRARPSRDYPRREANASSGRRPMALHQPGQGMESFPPPPASFAPLASKRDVQQQLNAEPRIKSEPRDEPEPRIKPEPLD